MGDRFLGIDSGTHATKAILVEGNTGTVIAQGSAPHRFIEGLPEGHWEQDPAVWVKAMEKAVRQVMTSSKAKPSEIKAIGVSAQQHGLVPLDEKGEVIRPAKLWCDHSTAAQAETIVRKVGGYERLLELTGLGLPVGYTAPKIAWLKSREPRSYKRLVRILLPHDYLNYVLTGRVTMEPGDASGTGLFNTKTRDWEPAVIDVIDPMLRQMLPEIRPNEEPAGELQPGIARKLGLEPGTLVSSGGGDNMMAAIGTGNTRIGMVTASIGTSGTISAYSSRPVMDSTGEVAAFCDSTGAWLPLVCIESAAASTELVKKSFRWDNDRLAKEVQSVPPGSDGLILLPYFEGERVPYLPHGRGIFFGLNHSNFSNAHFARATMEGVGFALNYGLGKMRDLGVRPKQIRITGGGANSPVWRQILADIFDAEVICVQTSEGACFGAALQARWCYSLSRGEKVKISQLTDKFVKLDKSTSVRPRKAQARVYRQMQLLFNDVTRANAPLFARPVN